MMALVLTRRKTTAWEMPLGLGALLVMPQHISHFLPVLYENSGLY